MTAISTSIPSARSYELRVVVVMAAVVISLALFPIAVKKPYVLHMGIMLFLAVIQGQAWNVIGGYTGQHSIGHSAYFGIGAYTTMMMLELGKIAPWYGMWAGVLAALIL